MTRKIRATLHHVPPPFSAPIQQEADELLLLPGLRAERRGQFRCLCCNGLAGRDEWTIYVPAYVKKGDSPQSVTEACRLSFLNGSWVGWCLSCARELSGSPAVPDWMSKKRRSLLSRLWDWVFHRSGE